MRVVRASMGLILVLCCVCLRADESDPQKITLVGTIHRVMAIGAAESLVPVLLGFACLTVAWLVVAIGMGRRSGRV